MGKGNRARVQRAQTQLDNAQTYVAQKQPNKWVSTAIIVFIVAILVISLALNALYTSGTTMRGSKAMQSDNFTVSGTMMSYFFHSQYSAFVNTYGDLISYIGLDTSLSLKSQQCTLGEEDMTWFDYFMNSTTSYVGEMLLQCEYAKANGIELTEEELADVDEAIGELATMAANYGYSTSAYISAMYGSGVKESDVRSAMELILLANKGATDASDKFKAAITEEEILAYYDANPGSFLMADYLVRSYETELATIDKDDYETDEEYQNALNTAQSSYDYNKADLLAKAKEYEGLTGTEAFLEKLTADLTAEYDGYYDDDESLTDEEKDAKEKSAIATDLEAADIDGYGYQDPTAEDSDELAKWLFADGRKVGDTYIIEDEDEDAGTYKVYVYCVSATAYREEYLTADMVYALYTASDANAKTDAAALKDKLIADGVVTAEAFEAIVEEQSLSMAGKMEDMLKGSFGYDEVDEYIFAEGRKAGDCEVVELSTEYVAVLLYLGEGEEAWHASAKSGVLSEKSSAWYEELAETYTVERNEKALAKISA